MTAATFKPGQRVYRWWETIPGVQADQQPLTVFRVNEKTVTVRTDQNSEFRIEPQNLYPLPKDEDPLVQRDSYFYRTVCPGSTRRWNTGTVVQNIICPGCRRGYRSIGAKKPLRRGSRWDGFVPVHAMRTS